MKSKLFRLTTSLFACAAFASLQAQEDVTSTYIVNSTIVESNGVNSYQQMPNGWSVRNWVNSTESKVVKTTKTDTFLQTWAKDGVNLSWDFYQNIENLPAGLYTLEAFAFSDHANNTTDKAVVLYASTSEGEAQAVVGIGSTGLSSSIPQTDTYKVAVDNFMVSSDGKLTIGFKTNQTIQGKWHGVDNFKLLYYGSDKKTAVIAQAQKLTNSEHPEGYNTLVAAYSAKADALTAESTEEEVNAALEEGKALYKEIQAAIVNYNALSALMTEAETLLKNEWPGAAELQAADDAAFSIYGGDNYGTAVNTDFVKASKDLSAAIFKYRFTAPSSKEAPLDVSFLLTNANIEAGATGWTCTGGMTAKAIQQNGYGGIDDTNDLFTGTYSYEMWLGTTSAPFNASFYQAISQKLPSGIYTLTGAVSANDQGSKDILSGAYLFANEDTTLLTVKQNTSSPDIYTVSTLVVDSTLKVGYKLVNAYANWCVSDNYSLSYYKIDDATALSTLIKTAKNTAEKNMLPYELKNLNTAISTAENATANQESILAINNAISNANKAIESMKSFKAGKYARLAALVSPEEIVTFAKARLAIADQALLDAQNSAIFSVQDSILGNDLAYANLYVSASDIAATLSTENAQIITNSQASTIVAATTKSSAEALATLTADVLKARQMEVKAGSDVTSWITNPGFENTTFPAGWTNNSMSSNTIQPPLEITWFAEKEMVGNGFTGTKCIEKWIAVGSKLADYSIQQTIIGLPAGEYTISVWGKAIQQALSTHIDETTGEEVFNAESDTLNELKNVTGTYLFAQDQKTEISTPNIYDAELAQFSNVVRTNIVNNATASREPVSRRFSVKCKIATDINLTFGVKTESTTANWISFDNFSITCDKLDDTGIENVSAENTFKAFTQNGYIYVIGADKYSITNIAGQNVSTTNQLPAGIYIVTAEKQSIKVVVK